jgi:hypothetical protein
MLSHGACSRKEAGAVHPIHLRALHLSEGGEEEDDGCA